MPRLDLVALVVGLGGRVAVAVLSALVLVGVAAACRGEQREEFVKAGGLVAVFAALVAAFWVAVLVLERRRRARLLTRI